MTCALYGWSQRDMALHGCPYQLGQPAAPLRPYPQNRANVMLSRARHGMYIVSNAECIRGDKNSKFWRHVIETIEGRGLLRDALPLVCRSHGNVTEVASAEEMAIKSPMGGCMHLCQERMPCGHLCVSQCHAGDLRGWRAIWALSGATVSL